MFRSLVVPVDLGPKGDRAVAWAKALARVAGIPVELVHVLTPSMPQSVDASALQQRARDDAPEVTWTMLHEADPVPALLSLISARADALVIMATQARGAVSEQILGSMSEDLLAGGGNPLLLLGPRVDVPTEPINPTLVAGVDGSKASEALLPVIQSWVQTFAGSSPWLVEVLRPSARRPPRLRRGSQSASRTCQRPGARRRDPAVERSRPLPLGQHCQDADAASSSPCPGRPRRQRGRVGCPDRARRFVPQFVEDGYRQRAGHYYFIETERDGSPGGTGARESSLRALAVEPGAQGELAERS